MLKAASFVVSPQIILIVMCAAGLLGGASILIVAAGCTALVPFLRTRSSDIETAPWGVGILVVGMRAVFWTFA